MLSHRSLALLMIAAPIAVHAQARQAGATAAATTAAAPPPATKLEAFKPAAGSVVTLGYDELGRVGGASVDVREIHAAQGATVRGLVVTVTQNEYREETAFVDADEIPELLKGVDALLAVQSNPTNFKQFEVRYNTRGDLRLTAFNDSRGRLSYSIQAGRIGTAHNFLDATEVGQLRAMFMAAQQKLATP